MNDNVTIRPARPSDVAELAALATQLGYPSTAAEVAARLPHLLNDPDQLVAVAVGADDHAIASVHVVVRRQLESDAWVEVAALVVDEQARGAGSGKALLAHAEAWAAAVTSCFDMLYSSRYQQTLRDGSHAHIERSDHEAVRHRLVRSRAPGSRRLRQLDNHAAPGHSDRSLPGHRRHPDGELPACL